MPPRSRPRATPRHAQQVLDLLEQAHPEARCALHYRNAFELAVATILSAQCTDERVNMVTPRLFARFPDAPSLARAEAAEVEDIIRSTGFFRAKTRSLLGMAR
ncbi:MAG: endonuclease III, partial [Acidobacteria bacterium]|nr:endonuclease III [Acidobacteriota bacterium]